MKTEGSLVGKRCLVTGANSGIGWVTARRLAERGAEIWLLCRNEVRGQEALNRLASDCASWGSPSPHLLLADLSDLNQVRRVSQEVDDQLDSLDILINNAGRLVGKRQESEQGYELSFATNHLGPFALTLKLLPLLNQAKQGRVINVASEAHRVAKVDWDDLDWQTRPYHHFTAYGTTKLFNILFTRTLAQHLATQQSKVTVNSLHPGVIRSGFGKDDPGLFKLLATLAGPFLVSSERGARTTIYLASARDLDGVSGAYFIRRRIAKPRPQGRNDELAKRLWSVSIDRCRDTLGELSLD